MRLPHAGHVQAAATKRGAWVPVNFMRTKKEIEDKRDDAAEVSRFESQTERRLSGTYVEGIRDALAWVLGDEDELEIK